MVSTATKMAPMTYRLIRLAPGSYDLELNGEIVASVVGPSSTIEWGFAPSAPRWLSSS
jgi:hypothetical protein